MPHVPPPQADSIAAARSRILGAYRSAFSSDAGRIILDHLRASAGSGRPAFLPPATGGPLDPYAAAFRDGRKSIVDEIEANLAEPEDQSPKQPAGRR